MSKYSDSIDSWMTTSRIETLVDGIFAIAMTLLVLSIGVPDISTSASEAAFFQQILTVWPKIMIYALSFWILAVFWRVNHQQFYFIKRSNHTLITINIFWLLFIALVPFSSELVGEYGSYFTANAIFHLNLFFAGLLYYINWHYAVKKGLVDENLDPKKADYMKKTNLMLPILSLIAIGLAYYIHGWSSLIYIASVFLKRIF